ncbi:MAG: protein kinase [Planctomycetota bacterium]
MPDKLELAHSIFEDFIDAAEGRSPSDMATFLDERCGADSELRRIVSELVENYEGGLNGFLTRSTESGKLDSSPTTPADSSELEGQLGLTIVGNLGEGAHGEVYRAVDKALDRQVAVKVIKGDAISDPKKRARFLQEARLVASLDHKNIVRIHSVEESDGQIRLVLEYVEGRTLQEILGQSGPMSPSEAAQVGVALCRALSAMHGQSVLHMDIKPGNVMRAAGGRIVLLDFGVAHRSEGDLPAKGAIGGTPLFMAPEQLDPERAVDARTDLYALGVMLYHLVSKSYPIEASSMTELVSKKANARSARPLLDVRSDVPGEFAELVERATAFDPDDRYQSAGEMESALRGFLAGVRPGRDPVKAGARWILGALAILAIALPLGWWWMQNSDAAEESPSKSMVESDERASTDKKEADAASSTETPNPETGDPTTSADAQEDDAVVEPTAEATLLRKGSSALEFTELGWDDPIRTDDVLSLRLHLSEPSYVYAFNVDTAGMVARLFPDPELVLQNPLPAEREVRLPGLLKKGNEPGWPMATTPGGRDFFILVTSPLPDPDAEALINDLPFPGEAKSANELTARSQRTIRGVVKKKASTSKPTATAETLEDVILAVFGEIPVEPVNVRRGEATWILLSVPHAD